MVLMIPVQSRGNAPVEPTASKTTKVQPQLLPQQAATLPQHLQTQPQQQQLQQQQLHTSHALQSQLPPPAHVQPQPAVLQAPPAQQPAPQPATSQAPTAANPQPIDLGNGYVVVPISLANQFASQIAAMIYPRVAQMTALNQLNQQALASASPLQQQAAASE